MRAIGRAVILAFSLCALPASGAAAGMNFTFSGTTGDKELDVTLRSMNLEAKQRLPSFYTSMNLNFGTGDDELNDLLGVRMLSPADAYLALRISVITGKPVDRVLILYDKHRKKGWGCVAKKLGIKPGSAEFRRLKTGGTVILERSRKERQNDEELRIKASVRVQPAAPGHGHGEKPEKDEGRGKGKGKR